MLSKFTKMLTLTFLLFSVQHMAHAVVAGGMVAVNTSHPSRANGYSSLESPMKVLEDGGPDANYYWATQYYFTNTGVGYFGLQNRSGPRWLNFSIWDAVSGSGVGGNCRRFGHEGSGIQCDMAYDWREGVVYSLELRSSGVDEWEGSVVDGSTGARTVIARIKVPSGWGNIKPGTISFVEEYSQGAGQLASCQDVGRSAIVFYPDTLDQGSVFPTNVNTNTYGNCEVMAQSYCDGDSKCYGNINGGGTTDGDTLSGTSAITSLANGQCVDIFGGSAANGTNATLYSCHGGNNQLFIARGAGNGYNLVAQHSNRCLDVAGASMGRATIF